MKRGRCLGVALLGAYISVSAPAAGQSLDVDPARYRATPATATIGVRVYAESRPKVPETPLTQTTVLLYPRSPALLARFADVKVGARDSLAKYRGAVDELRRAQDALGKALGDAGGEDLVRRVNVSVSGTATFETIPSGDWVLVAWHSEFIDTPAAKTNRRERRMYTLGQPLEGYRAVRIWLRELVVKPGAQDTIELTDRNVWFSGVDEVVRTDTGR